MDRSPKGREIESVEGNPGDIISRGRDIRRLGLKMLSCAETLETIKNEAVGDGGQKGKAIEKLKDSIGDSYEKLREAGELYKPVGPVITTYGHALDSAQPIINNSADDCVEKWAIFQSLPGDENGTTNPEDVFDLAALAGGNDEGPTDAQKTAAANNAAKQAAHQRWQESAEDFDAGYDTWEAAFDAAVDGIGDELSGSIKDSFWDKISSFVEVLVTVLSWAALIIGVIAFFAGGWVLAAIALGISALVLAITAVQAANGDKSLKDVMFAALAILPVGKISHLAKLAHFPRLAKVFGGAGASRRIWGAVNKGPISTVMKELASGKAFKFLSRSQISNKLLGPSLSTARSPHVRLYVNGGREALTNSLPQFRNIVRGERVLGIAGTWTGHYAKLATALNNSGGPNIKLPSWVGVFV